ncbi:MAG: hypothetical protein WCO33_02635 [bacterium]
MRKTNNVFIYALLTSVISVTLVISLVIVLIYFSPKVTTNKPKPSEYNTEVTTDKGKSIKIEIPSEFYLNSYDVINLKYPSNISIAIKERLDSGKKVLLSVNNSELTITSWWNLSDAERKEYLVKDYPNHRILTDEYDLVLEKSDHNYNYYFVGYKQEYSEGPSYSNAYDGYSWNFKVPRTEDTSFVDDLVNYEKLSVKYELTFQGNFSDSEEGKYYQGDYDSYYYFTNEANENGFSNTTIINKDKIPSNITLTSKEIGKKYIIEGYTEGQLSVATSTQKLYAVLKMEPKSLTNNWY